MISQTAKRWSGSLGLWGVGAGTALVFVRSPAASCCTLFLLNGFSLASLCDAEGEKHPASQDTCGASLASPYICLPTVRPPQLSGYYEDKTPASDKPF